MPFNKILTYNWQQSFDFSRMLRFGVCGLGGMLLDFSITWLCKEKLKWNKYAANSAGFAVAVTNNYLLNRLWTFQDHTAKVLPQFTSFIAVSLVGLLLNNLLLALFHQRLKMNFYFAKLLAIGIVFLWNYFGSSYFTFSS
jgi:putative flippase GtrA